MTRRLPAACLALLAAGCTATIVEPETSIAAVRAASAGDFPPLAIGSFERGPTISRSADRAVGLRASTIKPPNGGSFSAYLGQTAATQLRLAGKLDSASPLRLSATLTESSANPAIGKARGALGAVFRLHRGGAVVFEKALRVEAGWNSSFIGALAIPDAEREYTALYPRLIELLFADPDFRAALTR